MYARTCHFKETIVSYTDYKNTRQDVDSLTEPEDFFWCNSSVLKVDMIARQ